MSRAPRPYSQPQIALCPSSPRFERTSPAAHAWIHVLETNSPSAANLTTAGQVINGTEEAVLHINDSIVSVNLVLTGNGSVAQFIDDGGLDTIDPAMLEDFDEGRDAVTEAKELTTESAEEVAE